MTPACPDWLHGAWHRPLLRFAGVDDVTTAVRYVQTPSRFGDVRIPASRPAHFRGRPLSALEDGDLLLLAEQQGFAGWTSANEMVVTWTRTIDYQPPAPTPDVGRITFDGPDTLVEHGVHADYLEHWNRLPHDGGARVALERLAPDRPAALLVVTGDHFVLARDRATPLPAGAASLLDCCRDASRGDRLRWLDCELSWGRLRGGTTPFGVLLSTLPEREGASPFAPPWFRDADTVGVHDATGGAWRLLDGDLATLRTLGLLAAT